MSLGQPPDVTQLWVTKTATGAGKFLEGPCEIQTHPEGECDPRQEPDPMSPEGRSCRETFEEGQRSSGAPRTLQSLLEGGRMGQRLLRGLQRSG